jgi:hypothetical protein
MCLRYVYWGSRIHARGTACVCDGRQPHEPLTPWDNMMSANAWTSWVKLGGVSARAVQPVPTRG